MESGHFRVEVLELHPEPHGAPTLLLEHLVLGDSMAVSEAATLWEIVWLMLAPYFVNRMGQEAWVSPPGK